jgi:hypothetical protein
MPLDPILSNEIDKMLNVAAGLAHKGQFTVQQGRWMGCDLVIVIAVGAGAHAINSLLDAKAKPHGDMSTGGIFLPK